MTIAEHLDKYLNINKILSHNLSSYRKWHTTDTTMFGVWSGVQMAADAWCVVLLGLLDLSVVLRALLKDLC